MSTPQAKALGSVQKTLLLPLWGRAVEAKKPHPRLSDLTAAKIIAAVDYDFATIARNISFVTQLAWIARALHIDRTAREFLGRNAGATIVNLGCGLDTTFERVDNGRVRWFDVDLPDVIELRKRFIADTERRRSIACSLLEDRWLGEVNQGTPVLFIAAGVLYYFEPAQVKGLLIRIADVCPGSEILFDACSPFGLKAANEKVIKAGGMDASAILKWALSRPSDLRAWDRRIAILAAYPLFRHFKKGLTMREKWGTFLSDTLRVMRMVHLRLG